MATQIEIHDISATLHTVDSNAPLSRPVLEQLAKMVVTAMQEQQEHRDRAESERRITGGVSSERDSDFET
jgi:hypothetical protein